MNPSAATQTPPSRSSTRTPADAVFSKISWRILPVLLLAYMIAYLDRINIGYAQLQMKHTLPWGEAVYGLGAGIFFIGYFLFEVPSNLLLEKFGARKTLLRIMVLWGIAATAILFVKTPGQFYFARFLLGTFEAGFFPGVILYFTYWYPPARRGQAIAIFMSATTITGVLAGPVSGAILKYLDGVNGWHGWQWLYLLEGLPALPVGVLLFLRLDDKPADAAWLSAAEKTLVHDSLVQGAAHAANVTAATRSQLLRDSRVWLLSLVYFLLLGATYMIVFWMPTLIQSWGLKDVLLVSVLTAIPNACGVAGMIVLGRSSDRRRERQRHFAAAVVIAAAGLWMTTLLNGSLIGSLMALSFGAIGIASATPLFFALVSERLTAAKAAAGIALISSLGNLGPAVSPSLNGLIVQHTGSTLYSIYLVVALYVAAGLVLLVATRRAGEPYPQHAG
ncbi:MFS transporter [Trinickia terrae]|uniref:MFS transporter n=1 Tax=Trinickia terrae TaxID=2571161 RepID=A0A4V5PIG4_9BURK|nr:MFS transporter [Trinickia terrae]TKC87300.1 MFS transporter [Trinickia terrae]